MTHPFSSTLGITHNVMTQPSSSTARMIALFTVVVFATILGITSSQARAQAESGSICPAAPDTNQVHHPDSSEQAFITVLNSMREDPASFLPAIERYGVYVRSFRSDQKGLNKALNEIRKRLKKEKPLPPLTTSLPLQRAANDHVADLAKSGLTGHIGSDGSNPGTRVQRYGPYTTLGECITMGYLTAELMLASMLVDEGTPDRGHREILLKPYHHIGVGIQEHPSLRLAAVVVVGG